MAQSAYITDLTDREQKDTLRKYVDGLDSKIDYAKWKQSLVLSYNYMPLQSIKEKIDTERKNYIRKMDEEETKLRKTVENKEIITQLQLFREFSKKLSNKMKEIQLKIDNERMKIKVLTTEADDKRVRLKQILRENMNLTTTFYNQQGINTKADLVRLSRTHSLKGVMSHRKNTYSKTTNFDSINSVRNARNSYDECVQSITKALRGMNSSDDVQSGIYLDIMNKKNVKSMVKPRYSTKSNICHTLMDRYGSLNTKHKRENEDFEMSWQTFSELNWKQIMGIILVKDPEGMCLKNLLQTSQ